MRPSSESHDTDRIPSESESIRIERDRLLDAIAGIPNGILLWDAEFRLVFANPEAAKLLGFVSVDELLLASEDDILSKFEILESPRDPNSANEFPGRRALRGESAPEMVIRYRVRSTGEEFWSNIQSRPIVDNDGAIKHVVTVLRDVTAPKKTESTLRFMTELTSLLSSSLDYEETLSHVARLLVPRIADWSAVQLVETNGSVSRLVVAHSDPAKVAWARELQERYPFDPESPTGVAYVLRTGETLYFPQILPQMVELRELDEERRQLLHELAPRSVVIAPLIARGRTLGAITLCMAESLRVYGPEDVEFVKDLAWRSAIAVDNARLYFDAQQATLLAERQADQLRELTEASMLIYREVLLTTVMQSIADRSRSVTTSHMALITLTNSETWAQSITARSFSERYDRWQAFEAPIDGSGIYHLVCQTNTPLRLRQQELESHALFRRYGAYADQHPPLRGLLAVPLVGRDGRNIGLVQVSDRYDGDYTLEDEHALTQISRMASIAIENVRLVEEAQAAVRSRDQFLSMAAHELKTPLTSIKGFVQLLIRRLRKLGFDAQFFELSAGNLEEQIERLENLLNDLLDTTRLQYQGNRLKREAVEIRTLAERTVKRFEHTTEMRDNLSLILDAPESIVGNWDPERLDQILTNLISNALKYSPDGGEVRIGISRSDESAVIAVSDQGIGMNPEDLSKIFEPFSRSETARSVANGTGLGLFITRQMVEQHRGTITVQSQTGTGSVFTVTLPLTAGQMPSQREFETSLNLVELHDDDSLSLPARVPD